MSSKGLTGGKHITGVDTEEINDSHLEGQRESAWDFITSLRMMYNLKLRNYFWNFLFNFFGPKLAMDNWHDGKWKAETKTLDEGGYRTVKDHTK